MRLLRLERYVLAQTLTALGGALAIIGSLVLLIDFVEVSRSVGSDVDLPAIQVLGLTLLVALNGVLVAAGLAALAWLML